MHVVNSPADPWLQSNKVLCRECSWNRCLSSSVLTRSSSLVTGLPITVHSLSQASTVSEPQEEEEVAEEEEEDEPKQVVVENESYVNLKKKLSKKYDVQAKSLYNENVKICTQFRLKKV